MAESEASPTAPPNLRAADDEAKECDTCTYFDHGHCTKYPPLVVDGEWTCDAWKGKGAEVGQSTSARPSPIRAAQKGALANLRAPGARPAV